MADEKYGDQEGIESKYEMTIQVNETSEALEIIVKDKVSKEIYSAFFSATDLQAAGIPMNQSSNLQAVAEYIETARTGAQNCTFDIEESSDDGNKSVKIRVTQSPFIDITLNLIQIVRSVENVNKDHIIDLSAANERLKQRLVETERRLTHTEQKLSRVEQHVMPRGAVVMWTGSASSIPSGWRLCDGSNGTPDLRNRFVIGASDDHPPNQSGGQRNHSHTITVNGHSLTTAQLPAHGHENSSSVLFHNAGSQWECMLTQGGLGGPQWQLHNVSFAKIGTMAVGNNAPHSHSATAVQYQMFHHFTPSCVS